MSKLREKQLFAQLVFLAAVGGALLSRNLYILAGVIAALSLVWLWTVLSRGDDELRADLADYGGFLGKPLAWLISSLPGIGPKVLCSLLAVDLFGFAVWGLLSVNRTATPVERSALVAGANSICAAAQNRVLSTANPDQGSRDLAHNLLAADQELEDLGKLAPAPDVARDWHRVLAGLVAMTQQKYESVQFTGDTRDRASLTRAERKGSAAERRLGIHCSRL